MPCLKDYGLELPQNVAAIDFVLAYDSNPDGRLDIEEFTELVTDLVNDCVKTKPLKRNQDLETTISNLSEGTGISNLDPVLLFRTADSDGGGNIDYAGALPGRRTSGCDHPNLVPLPPAWTCSAPASVPLRLTRSFPLPRETSPLPVCHRVPEAA